MAEFTVEEYADIIYVYGLVDGNDSEALREYQRRFPNRRVPDRRVFSRTFRRLKETGSVTTPRAEARSGTSADSAETDQQILNIVRNSPEISIRQVARRLGLSVGRVWTVVNREGLHPYHHTPVQALHQGDSERRLQFCTWLLESDIENRRFIDRILWTDESQFTRDGITNFHNLHTWSDVNPHRTRCRSFQQRFSANVWAGIIGNQLIGPFILPQVLNSQLYSDFLENTLPDLLEDIPLATRSAMYLQHDGAPAHTANIVRAKLNEHYPERWIGRGGPIPWPARSPDLNPLDFFLWGMMKDDVYSQPINTREELVTRIGTAATKIRERLATIDLKRGIRKRLLTCIETGGEHFEHLL